MSEPTTDMYTTVERSIYHTLKNALTAAGAEFPVFNNMVDKKKFKDAHASVSIMKVSDVFTASNGGGPWAKIDTAVLGTNGQPASYTRQPWPDSYDLMYQVECEADNLADLRVLETIVRQALRPRQPMYLWDSNATPPAFGSEWIEYHYAGYINRDVPVNNIYNRILNVRFEARDFPAQVTVPAITQIQTSVEDSTGNSLFEFEYGS